MLPYSQGHRGAECSAVVMQTRAFDFEVLPVQPETARWIEMKLANAKQDSLIVKDLVGAIGKRRRRGIQGRIVKIPPQWIFDCQFILENQRLAGIDGIDAYVPGIEQLAIRHYHT